MFLLSRLGDQYRTKMRDKLVPAILKFLTIKRPIDCDRVRWGEGAAARAPCLMWRSAQREFFAYAEAFASLVKLEFVSITGAGHWPRASTCCACADHLFVAVAAAVTTITTLLQQNDTRCAAITMLVRWLAAPDSQRHRTNVCVRVCVCVFFRLRLRLRTFAGQDRRTLFVVAGRKVRSRSGLRPLVARASFFFVCLFAWC